MSISPNIILFDSDCRDQLLPLTFTRPVADLRVGILTIKEKFEKLSGCTASFLTQDYLQQLFPLQLTDDNILIDGSILPDKAFIDWALEIPKGVAYKQGDRLIAAHLSKLDIEQFAVDHCLSETVEQRSVDDLSLVQIAWPSDLFTLNDRAIRADFQLITTDRVSQPLPESNTLIGTIDQLFIEEGASVEASILNVKEGPIYIGKDAKVLEGCMLRGPVALGERSVLKMGAKIYGATSIGYQCKVGGEISNVVFQCNSNKGHDGYLGNAVIGEWCNIGADTNASNLKNDYSEVKVWSYTGGRFRKSGLQFHGLIMGDHSKSGINTMFNTGSVIGVSANVYGEGFPRTFIPSFSWGGAGGLKTYRLDKALETAERVMIRRNKSLTAADKAMLAHVFEITSQYRPK